MADDMNILVLNAGSSSQKMALYRLPAGDGPVHRTKPVWAAHVDWTRESDRVVIRTEHDGEAKEAQMPMHSREDIQIRLIDSLTEEPDPLVEGKDAIHVVGHRVVHGGPDFASPTPVDDSVKHVIRDFSALAPTHNPAQLEGIEVIERLMGDVPQVAVFDTAFHQRMPPHAKTYPLPHVWHERGIRRYGFHGISHQYCVERAADILGKQVADLDLVTCHLGNGCSLAAVHGGVSVDTTMGLTPLEGVMMATRSGSIDPSIPLHMMREHGLDVEQVDAMLNRESGLKGVSGLSGDMRTILEAVSDGHPRATLALDMYVHGIRKTIGGMVAVLGGADALIFTAGVGEHASAVRERICGGLECMGVHVDPDRNRTVHADDDIATADSRARILIVHTDEDWVIARACHALLDNGE